VSFNVLEGYAYGKLKDNSSNEWTGTVGALQSGEADLTVSELSITEERLKVVTYTQPIYIISVSLIVYTSYSATLVSHLAVEQPASLPFSNLRDLSRQSGWDAGCNNNDLFQVTASVGPWLLAV
ncbi:hypothetical protein O3P69_007848, partial [Scylla paramamosain]